MYARLNSICFSHPYTVEESGEKSVFSFNSSHWCGFPFSTLSVAPQPGVGERLKHIQETDSVFMSSSLTPVAVILATMAQSFPSYGTPCILYSIQVARLVPYAICSSIYSGWVPPEFAIMNSMRAVTTIRRLTFGCPPTDKKSNKCYSDLNSQLYFPNLKLRLWGGFW